MSRGIWCQNREKCDMDNFLRKLLFEVKKKWEHAGVGEVKIRSQGIRLSHFFILKFKDLLSLG